MLRVVGKSAKQSNQLDQCANLEAGRCWRWCTRNVQPTLRMVRHIDELEGYSLPTAAGVQHSDSPSQLEEVEKTGLPCIVAQWPSVEAHAPHGMAFVWRSVQRAQWLAREPFRQKGSSLKQIHRIVSKIRDAGVHHRAFVCFTMSLECRYSDGRLIALSRWGILAQLSMAATRDCS